MIAVPNPTSGTGSATMRSSPRRSSLRSAPKRLAAASRKSPDCERISTAANRSGWSSGFQIKAPTFSPGWRRRSSGLPATSSKRGASGVVALQLAGRQRTIGALGETIQFTQETFQFLDRRAAGSEKAGAGAGQGDDGRLYADWRSPSVEHQIQLVEKLFSHMPSLGWTYVTKPIRARSRDGRSRPPDQRPGHRMGGYSQGDGFKARGHDRGDNVPLGNDQGQGAGPEALHENPGRSWDNSP